MEFLGLAVVAARIDHLVVEDCVTIAASRLGEDEEDGSQIRAGRCRGCRQRPWTYGSSRS